MVLKTDGGDKDPFGREGISCLPRNDVDGGKGTAEFYRDPSDFERPGRSVKSSFP